MKLSELGVSDMGLGIGMMTQDNLTDEMITTAISYDKFHIRSAAHAITRSFLPREISAMNDSEKIYWCGCGRPAEDIVVSWSMRDHPTDHLEDQSEIDTIYMEMKTYMKRFEPSFYRKYALVLNVNTKP